MLQSCKISHDLNKKPLNMIWTNKLLIAHKLFDQHALNIKEEVGLPFPEVTAALGVNWPVTKSVMTVLPGPPMVTHCALVVTLLGAMLALLGATMVTLLNFPKHVTPLLHDPFKWQPHFDTWAMVSMIKTSRLDDPKHPKYYPYIGHIEWRQDLLMRWTQTILNFLTTWWPTNILHSPGPTILS